MPPSPPQPLLATLSAATRILVVTFDKPLQPASTAPGNWRCWANIGGSVFRHIATVAGTVAGSTATVQMVQDIGSSGLNRVNYAAVPADVIGLNGLPAAAFTGFPLTVNP